jgi:hypothetical protein
MKIPAQSAIPVTICATPAASGLRLATLTLSGTASGKNINGSLPLEVFGEVACASPNPAALFASVKVVKNNFDTESVVITNCGDVPGVYTGAVSGDGYSILSPAGGVTAPVAPRASVTFQIVFNPSSTGVKNGNLLVHSPSIANLTIPLSGEGACAIPTAQTFNIPQTGVGNTNTFDITITNTGNFGWTPGTGVITPADVFSVISITPATIPPGGSADVKVQFAPKATGLVTAQLTFPNAGPCEETTVKVDLSGTGVVSDVKQISADGMWLEQNYPNPFTSYTTFSYSLPTESAIRISVSDMTGKVIKELVSGRVSAGEHTLSFNASTLASSTYVYTLECGPIKLSRNFVLSK